MLHVQTSFIQPEACKQVATTDKLPLNSLEHNAIATAVQVQSYYWSDQQVTPVHVALSWLIQQLRSKAYVHSSVSP